MSRGKPRSGDGTETPGVPGIGQPPPTEAPTEGTHVPGPEWTQDYRADTSLGATAVSLPDSPALPCLPGYSVEGVLGRGGMGVVYRARHLALNRPVALKMIRAGASSSASALARFRSEAQAAARLQHPNIVQIYEVGEHDGLPYCALELVEGGSLAAKVGKERPAPREAARLVEVLAGAMHFAHCRNVVHRDLKPANVLLAADGTPKVTDFGLARQLDTDSGQTRPGVVMGTPSYMAPEQASGQSSTAGPPADVYALGAILYTLLTGQPPFRGTTSLETLDQVRHQGPVPPSRLVSGVPRDLETICLKCLAKEPDRRYASAQELAEDLRHFQNGEPVRARPVGPGERLWRWARRNPAVAALVAVIHVLALAGIVGIVWQWREAVTARGQAQSRAEAEAQAKRQTELTLADMHASFGMQADAHNQPAQAVLWFAHAARQASGDPTREYANRLRCAAWERQTFRPVAAVMAPGEWLNQFAFHPVAHPVLGARYLLAETLPPKPGPGQWILWDLETESVVPFPANVSTPTAAAWNPEGNLLALGDDRGEVVLFEFRSASNGPPFGKVHQQLHVRAGVQVLAFGPAGRNLHEGGSTTLMTGEQWLRRWRERGLGPALP
jgi:hypothetical protein